MDDPKKLVMNIILIIVLAILVIYWLVSKF